MRDTEKFKTGFLKEMAERGLLPSDFERAMLNKTAGDVGKAVAPLALLTRLGIVGLVGFPAVTGMALGAATHGALQADDEDLEEIKRKETIALYRQLAGDVRERQQYASQ